MIKEKESLKRALLEQLSYQGDCVHAQPVFSEEDSSLHTVREVDFTVIVHWVTKQINNKTIITNSWGKSTPSRVFIIYYLKYPVFNRKLQEHKDSGKCDPHNRRGKKKQATETSLEKDKMPDLTEEDFKVAIVNMLKEWKGSMIEEIKEGMKTIVHQVENVRKEMEIIKKKDPNGISIVEMYNAWNVICIRLSRLMLFSIAKKWKQPEYPTNNEYVNKMLCIMYLNII